MDPARSDNSGRSSGRYRDPEPGYYAEVNSRRSTSGRDTFMINRNSESNSSRYRDGESGYFAGVDARRSTSGRDVVAINHHKEPNSRAYWNRRSSEPRSLGYYPFPSPRRGYGASAGTSIASITTESHKRRPEGDGAAAQQPRDGNTPLEELSSNDVPGSGDIKAKLLDNTDTRGVPNTGNDEDSGSIQGSSSETEEALSETDSSSSFISPLLGSHQREAVDSIMLEVMPLLSQRFSVKSRPTGPTSSSSSSPGQQTSGRSESTQTSISPGGSSGASSRKRSAKELDDGRGSSKPMPGASINRKLACPYYKQDPRSCVGQRACAGPGWPTTHRVKEHIYRNHGSRFQCTRCGRDFSEAVGLSEHTRQPQPCDLQEFQEPAGHITREQEQALRRKPKLSCPEEEKWKRVFKILFPHVADHEIPSPYYSNDDWGPLDRYDRYLEQELPRVVRRRLEQEASAFSGPLETHLRGMIEQIVRESQVEISQHFRASGDRQEVTPGSPGEEETVLENSLLSEQPSVLSQIQSSSEQLVDFNFHDELFASYDPDPVGFNENGYLDLITLSDPGPHSFGETLTNNIHGSLGSPLVLPEAEGNIRDLIGTHSWELVYDTGVSNSSSQYPDSR